MIDLASEELPCKVRSSQGELVAIETSFRVWLRFARLLQEMKVMDMSVIRGVYDEDGNFQAKRFPVGDVSEGLREFLESPVSTPKKGVGGQNVMDYLEDGDYIVGAFQQAYGIDLTSEDLHWHRFLALVRSLPSETKYAEIIGYRSYDESQAKKKPSEARKLLRERWSLPNKDEATLKWQQEMFAGIRPVGGENG